MAENVVGIDIVARLDNFRAQLAEIPNIGGKEAKSLVAQLSKEIKAAERAAKAAGDSSKRAARDVREFGDSAGRAGSSAAKLAGFLGMISPQAAEAARGLADLADVGEVGATAAGSLGVSMTMLGGALAAAAAAALPIAGALVVMTREADEAAARTAFLNAHLHDLDASGRALEEAMLSAAVATGRLTEEQGKLIAIESQGSQAVEDFRRSQEAERTTANEAYFAAERRLRQLEVLPDFLKTAADYYGGYTSAQQENLKVLRDLDKIEQDNQETVVGTIASQKEAVVAEEAAKRSKEAHEKSVARLNEALRVLNEQLAESTRQAQASSDAFTSDLSALMDMQDAAEHVVASKEQQLELDRRAATARATAYRDDALANASTLSAKETAEEQYRATVRALDAAYYADLQKLRDDDAKRQAEQADKAAQEAEKQSSDLAQKAADYAVRGLGMVAQGAEESYTYAADAAQRLTEQLAAGDKYYTAAQKKELESRIKQHQAAAKRAFEIGQAARLSEAVISTATSVAAAWADGMQAGGPIGPAVAAAFAATAAAAGAIQIGAIASEQPSFHKGGPIDMAPDEMGITARRHEFMLNPTGRTTIGDDAAHRANAGVSPGGGEVIAVSVYRHTRQVERWKADGLLAGDPIALSIAAGKMVGHRSR